MLVMYTTSIFLSYKGSSKYHLKHGIVTLSVLYVFSIKKPLSFSNSKLSFLSNILFNKFTQRRYKNKRHRPQKRGVFDKIAFSLIYKFIQELIKILATWAFPLYMSELLICITKNSYFKKLEFSRQ